MQKDVQAREKHPDSAKLAAMIGHRLRSEHREVLAEPLPERWMDLMNAIHAIPEHDDAKQNDAASLLLNRPAPRPA